jgi:hypothetical protein
MRDDDDFLGEDIGYPNRRAQYRGFRFVLLLIALAGVAAIVFGLIQSGQEILAAFPTWDSLGDKAAWLRLLQGLGDLAVAGLFVTALALYLRWRIRKRRAKKAKKNGN